MIFLGRVVHGIGEGMLTVVTVIYISEFIQEKHRGGTLSSLIIGCLLGLVLYYVCFALISLRIAAGVFTARNIILLLCSYAIEESPPWRLFKEKDMKDNAKNDKDIEDVFTEIQTLRNRPINNSLHFNVHCSPSPSPCSHHWWLLNWLLCHLHGREDAYEEPCLCGHSCRDDEGDGGSMWKSFHSEVWKKNFSHIFFCLYISLTWCDISSTGARHPALIDV